jgi:hypothetical protein
MRRYGLLALGLLAAGVLVMGPLVGCGQAGNAPGAGSTSGAPASSGSDATRPAVSASDLPSHVAIPPRSPATPPSSKPVPGQLTIRGQLKDGVEAGCRLLTSDDGKTYLLVGNRTAVTGSGRFEVVGQPVPDLVTTCQQGIPFQVTEAHPL